MKTEELEKIGLTKEQIADVMKINGIDIEDLKEKNQTLTTERDNYKTQYDTAKATLDGFEGKDFDAITRDRDAWKKKAEGLEEEQKKAAKAAELEKAINDHVSTLKFKDDYRKRAYIEDLRKEGYQVNLNDRTKIVYRSTHRCSRNRNHRFPGYSGKLSMEVFLS